MPEPDQQDWGLIVTLILWCLSLAVIVIGLTL
jgi:hypothetical protein